MYGTSTPQSDKDIKGIYISPLDDIVFGRSQNTVVHKTKANDGTKNTKDDIDTEYKELRTFLREASEGQTYALDMLFCPEESVIKTSDLWKEIQANRLKLLSKSCKPILGYVTGQCAKYAMKGTRLDAVEQALAWSLRHNPKDFIENCLDDFPEVTRTVDGITHYLNQKHLEKDISNNGKFYKQSFVLVIGRHFGYKLQMQHVTKCLSEFINNFGDRARLAKNNEGIDWKAVSHAVRLLLEANELALTGFVTMPLKRKDWVLSIKKGQEEWSEINSWINNEMEVVFGNIKNSSFLLDKSDQDYIDSIIRRVYLTP